jgi:hypothetical protein
MATSRVSNAGLPGIRARVGRALDDFLDRQRDALGAIGADMLPWMDARCGRGGLPADSRRSRGA